MSSTAAKEGGRASFLSFVAAAAAAAAVVPSRLTWKEARDKEEISDSLF